MTENDQTERPWLMELASAQRGNVAQVPAAAYDKATQMTQLQESGVALIDTDHLTVTKKADREVGEDQKG
jgi:hypothetical protein